MAAAWGPLAHLYTGVEVHELVQVVVLHSTRDGPFGRFQEPQGVQLGFNAG